MFENAELRLENGERKSASIVSRGTKRLLEGAKAHVRVFKRRKPEVIEDTRLDVALVTHSYDRLVKLDDYKLLNNNDPNWHIPFPENGEHLARMLEGLLIQSGDDVLLGLKVEVYGTADNEAPHAQEIARPEGTKLFKVINISDAHDGEAGRLEKLLCSVSLCDKNESGDAHQQPLAFPVLEPYTVQSVDHDQTTKILIADQMKDAKEDTSRVLRDILGLQHVLKGGDDDMVKVTMTISQLLRVLCDHAGNHDKFRSLRGQKGSRKENRGYSQRKDLSSTGFQCPELGFLSD
ncbi:MAG: hypothetical protein J3Q66DRAFT_366066 [Benniella sp.]|nr:MAG: hypothetical protein J3Q66DRAFT_366066 [Benniella sp.]